MKKAVKIIAIILAVILVLAGSLAIWQWKNIQSIMYGIKESSEEIEKRRNDNQMDLICEINKELEMPLRELTPEEKQKMELGEKTVVDVYAEVFKEKETLETESKPTGTAPTKDEIISKYMAELYLLQSEFTAKAESTISQGARYYESIKKHPQDPTARANTITHYTPVVRSLEADCDARVEKVIKTMEKELKSIGENTDITRTIRQTYENEKQLKLSFYANKYLK